MRIAVVFLGVTVIALAIYLSYLLNQIQIIKAKHNAFVDAKFAELDMKMEHKKLIMEIQLMLSMFNKMNRLNNAQTHRE